MAVGARVKKKDEIQPTRYYSKKQEDAVAKNLNGKRTPNSGATPFVKGDYIEYNNETKKYDIFVDVSRHGSPSYEKAGELSEEESRFLRACESFFDVYVEL